MITSKKTSTTSEETALSRSLKGHKDIVTSIDFHPCPSVLGSIRKKREIPQQIISSSADGLVHVWNYPQARSSSTGSTHHKEEARLYRFHGHTGCVHRVKYSPTGHLIASVSSDHTCRLWVPKANGDSIVLCGHQAPVKDVDFGWCSNTTTPNLLENSSESLLLTCSDDKTLKIWNLPTKSFRSSLLGHTNWVNSCKFSPHTVSIAASGSDDGTIRTWDIESSKNVVTYSTNAADAVCNIVFHPLGSLLAASLKSGIVEMYDLRCDSLVHKFYGSGESTVLCAAGGLCFHPSGNQLMTGFVDVSNESIKEGFQLWDVRTQIRSVFSVIHNEKSLHLKNERNSLKILPPKTSCCSFSNDGLSFATASNSKNVLIWQNNTNHHWCCDGEQVQHQHHISRQSDNKAEFPDENHRFCSHTTSTINPPSPTVQCPSIDVYQEDQEVNSSNLDKRRMEGTKINESSIRHPTTRNSMKSTTHEMTYTNTSSTATRTLLSEISGDFQQIHSRLDILTEIIVHLDKRLSIQEDTMAKLAGKARFISKLNKN